MARRRHARRHMHRSKYHALNHLITPASFLGAYLQQVTAKDVLAAQTAGTYQTLSTMDKAKFVFGNAIGRTTGWYPFANITGTRPFTLNVAGMANKWTGLGIGALIYSMLPIKQLPGKPIAKKVGSGLLAGGLVGGLFDDPVTTEKSQQLSYNYNVGAPATQSGIRGTGLAN